MKHLISKRNQLTKIIENHMSEILNNVETTLTDAAIDKVMEDLYTVNNQIKVYGINHR